MQPWRFAQRQFVRPLDADAKEFFRLEDVVLRKKLVAVERVCYGFAKNLYIRRSCLGTDGIHSRGKTIEAGSKLFLIGL
jgi:hypothetical protein